MIIGVPKEIKNNENRVGMTPSGVAEVVKQGHRVFIQHTAGINSGFPDEAYQAVGAHILPTIEDIYATAEMIVKVKEPIITEYNLIRKGQLLFTYFHFASDRELTLAMLSNKSICLAYETVEEADHTLPLLIPMSEVAGRMSIQEGARFLEKYELLIAVILSAQCTDKRVNMITPPLYKDFPTPEALAATTPEVIFEYIRSVSYPNNKAKHLVGMAKMLVNDFNSQVPDNLDDLIKLPGVGRKTANVIQSVVFNKAAMAVDTHVFRVSHRIGLVPDSCTTPFSVEKELVKNIPEKLIPIAHHWLILHGRYVCQARTPKCDTCGLQMMCKYFCNTYKVTKEEPKAKNK